LFKAVLYKFVWQLKEQFVLYLSISSREIFMSIIAIAGSFLVEKYITLSNINNALQ